MPRLNARDKLALALTSAGSQRNLAAAVGISPRALGRYLKGERTIPGYLLDSINQVFKIHRTIARQQAAVIGAPYSSAAPVFIERPPLQITQRGYEMKNGRAVPFERKVKVAGQRLFVNNTQYIRSEVRFKMMSDILQSPAVGAVTARNTAPARVTVRSRTSGFEKFAEQLRSRKLQPDDMVSLYTTYSGKLTPQDFREAALDLENKIQDLKRTYKDQGFDALTTNNIVFTLPRQPDETKPRKRGRKARR